jgi:hypothetical protein
MQNTINPLLHLTIDETLRQKIINFAYNQVSYFSSNGAGLGRRLCIISKTNLSLADEIKVFSKQCYNALGITEFDEEPLFGDFIGFNKEGAFVHEHTDPGQKTKMHVRLNFLIQKPESGGMPLINGIEYDIKEGYSWKNIASAWEHGSTPVVGSKERIVLSLGALIEEEVVRSKLGLINKHQSATVREIFGTNMIIEHCPKPNMYKQDYIIDNLTQFVQQFKGEVGEQRGHALSSCREDRGEIANLPYLQPLMHWIKDTVWKNRRYLENGNDAIGMRLDCNWVNEMFEGCSGAEHKHGTPVAVFYVRKPSNGANMIFTNGQESIAAGEIEGDLLIHDKHIYHSISEHKSPISRICLVLQFEFLQGTR